MNLTTRETGRRIMCVSVVCLCLCLCGERVAVGIGSLSIEAGKFNSTMQASRLQTQKD